MLYDRRMWICGLFLIGLYTDAAVWGQTRPGPRSSGKSAAKKPGDIRFTSVSLEILTSDGAGVRAQQWLNALESLEIAISFRRGDVGEEPETKEKVLGTIRQVTVIGHMDRAGKLTFADRTFELGDRVKIKAWIDDLKTYGAQGTPDGKPLWGLTEDQFVAVFDSLAQITTEDPRDQPLEKAIRDLPLPQEYPLVWSPAVKQNIAAMDRTPTARQSTEGFTTATSLALMLGDYGFGFRPVRTPNGDLELLVDLADSPEKVWPVGWPLKLPRQKAAPKLFSLQQMFLDDKTVLDVLGMASESANIPILLDLAELERIDPKWAEIQVLYPPRQATWHTVVRDVLNKAKLTFDLWQDEAGRPFLYVTSLKSKRSAK